MRKMLKTGIEEMYKRGNIYMRYSCYWSPTQILYLINRKCWNFYVITFYSAVKF